jgi:hypothetical protein
LAETILFHVKRDARRVSKFAKSWDDPRVSARLAEQDPNDLHFENGEWVVGVWSGLTEADDRSFRELSRLVRTVARAGKRGFMLLWNGTPVPELAQQLALPSVPGNGDPEYDRALIASYIERASQPAPQAPRMAANFATNWASAQHGVATATLVPPPPAPEPESFGVAFVQPEAKPRRRGILAPVAGVLLLAVGAAAAAPWALDTVGPLLGNHAPAPASAPSPIALSAPSPDIAAPPASDAAAPAALADTDLPKVEQLSPAGQQAALSAPPTRAAPLDISPSPPAKPTAKAAPSPKPQKKLATLSPPAPIAARAAPPSAVEPSGAAPDKAAPKTTIAATGAIVAPEGQPIATAPAARKPATNPAPKSAASPPAPDTKKPASSGVPKETPERQGPEL